MKNLSGRKLGNYELRERLGRGGMAEVYKAYQASMDRFVAVKVMLGHLADDDNFVTRFKREAQAVGRLRHPHIVQIFDFGIQDDLYYMAMEFVEGGNLKQYIIENQRLSIGESLKIAHDLADALDYAHKAGMVHRDIKPANIMFVDKADSDVVLTDFGIARILDATGLTGTGMAVGTPSYMSPEAGAGENADERADIYALGIILYEMLTGTVPYDADTPLAVIMKHINAPLPTRNDYGDLIPEVVERIILKSLAKNPDDRFQTAADMRQALAEAIKAVPHTVATDYVPSKQTDTKESAAGVHQETMMAEPDTPTSHVPQAASARGNGQSNLMTMGAIAVAAIILIGAGIFFFDDFFPRDNDNSEAAAPQDTIEATTEPLDEAEEVVQTELPTATLEEPTDVPQPTPAPTEEPVVAETNLLEPIYPPDMGSLSLLSGDVNPNDSRNIEFVAEELLFAGDFEGAETHVNQFINDDRNNIDGYAARVRLAVAFGDQRLAMANAEFMYELDPNNPNAHIALLDALYMQPLDDETRARAQMLLDEATAIDPENPAFIWRRIPLMDNAEEAMNAFNTAENSGAFGWRFVRFAGNFLYEQGEYQRAIPYLHAALGLPPELFPYRETMRQLHSAYDELGYSLYERPSIVAFGGEQPPHIENLSMLTNISEIMDIADEMVLSGDREGAIEFLNDILDDDPNNAEALFARSQIYALGWDEENLGGQDAERLLELQPDSTWGYLALSDSWLNYPAFESPNAIDEAIAAIEQAHALDPENPHVLWRLAQLGDWELELERMFQAEERGARGYRYVFRMGEVLYENRLHGLAIPYFEAYTRYTDPDTYLNSEAFWALLGALLPNNHRQIAFDYLLERNVVSTATDPETFGDAAFIAMEAGELDLAEEWANTALAMSPDAYTARYVQGYLAWLRENDEDTAIEIFTEIIEEDGYMRYGAEFGTYAGLNLDIARILTWAGRDEEALDYYNLVIEESLYLPFLYEERADLYLRLGDVEAARADLQEALNLEPDPELQAYYRDRIVELGPAGLDD